MKKLIAIVLLASLLLCLCGCRKDDYKSAMNLKENGFYDEAIVKFAELGGYKDSEGQIKDCRWLKFEALYRNSDSGQMSYNFRDLVDSIDSDREILEYEIKVMEMAEEYDYVWFGTYEQDGVPSTDSEPIRWLVVSKYDGGLVLMSDSILDAKYFDDYSDFNVTYEDCTLRSWLNDDFYYTAFSDDERGAMERLEYDDYVFLPSWDLIDCFIDYPYNTTQQTKYASEKMGSLCIYWTSTTAISHYLATQGKLVPISTDGLRDNYDVQYKQGVRPMIYVKLPNK